MALGISTASFFSKMYNEQAVQWIGEQGIPCCEVFLETYSEYELSFAKMLRNIADIYDLRISTVHAMSQQYEAQLFSQSLRQRKDAFEIFKKIVLAGQTMRATHYVMHGPSMNLGNKITLEHATYLAKLTAEYADYLADYGLMLCWENVSWCAFNRPEFATWISEVCRSDNLYFTFDVKQAIRSGYDPFVYLEHMGQRLANVHLCDYQLGATGEVKRLALPSCGDFDFHRLSSYLKDIHYQGDCVLEVYSNLYGNLEDLLSCYDDTNKIMALNN